MPPSQPPKNRGGRPRVHASKEAAAQAKKDRTRRWYQRSRQPTGPADFITYEPSLHGDVPADTPTGVGLRTNIQIPLDPNARQDEVRPNLPSPRPNPQPSAGEEDAEINEQIRRIQTKEQETNTEQVEREAEIAEILLGMRAAE
jgi:hypothetical protein